MANTEKGRDEQSIDLINLINQCGLSAKSDEICKNIRQSIILSPSRFASNRMSKFGGLPNWPADTPWPCDKEGIPLSFLVQVNLSELPVEEVKNCLPSNGILFFFYDADNQPSGLDPDEKSNWAVVYKEDNDQKQSNPDLINPGDQLLLRETPIEFRIELTLPSPSDSNFKKLNLSDKDAPSYFNLKKLLRSIQGYSLPIHRILGHPDEVQGQAEDRCQLVSQGFNLLKGPEGGLPQSRQNLHDSQEWELLLQLDSDPKQTGFEWIRDGRLFFWIKKNDLAEMRFQNAWALLEYT